MDDLRANIDRIVNAGYEQHVIRYVRSWLRTEMGLYRAKAIATPMDKIRLHAIVNEGVDHGAISEAEADDLIFTDLVFTGTGTDGEPRQVLAEVSLTATPDDCEKAARRAEIMARATGIPTAPAVISPTPTEALVNAHRPEITFLNIPNHE